MPTYVLLSQQYGAHGHRRLSDLADESHHFFGRFKCRPCHDCRRHGIAPRSSVNQVGTQAGAAPKRTRSYLQSDTTPESTAAPMHGAAPFGCRPPGQGRTRDFSKSTPLMVTVNTMAAVRRQLPKFDWRVNVRLTERSWPPLSPDLSLPGYLGFDKLPR